MAKDGWVFGCPLLFKEGLGWLEYNINKFFPQIRRGEEWLDEKKTHPFGSPPRRGLDKLWLYLVLHKWNFRERV